MSSSILNKETNSIIKEDPDSGKFRCYVESTNLQLFLFLKFVVS